MCVGLPSLSGRLLLSQIAYLVARAWKRRGSEPRLRFALWIIARWPGRIKAGATSEQVWAFWDFLPTMAELTGQKPPADLDGISVLPAWLEGKAVAHPPLYFEFHERGFSQAARIGDWKAVRLGTKLPIELYDLKADPSETTNLAEKHPAEVKRFEEFLKTARVDSALWPITENVRTGGGKGGAKQQPETK
jgi:arylsulfatase A-like enzyme